MSGEWCECRAQSTDSGAGMGEESGEEESGERIDERCGNERTIRG